MPLTDPSPVLYATDLLLPLSLCNADGTVEVTVVARDAGGCETVVSPGVIVTVGPPSLGILAETLAQSGGTETPNATSGMTALLP